MDIDTKGVKQNKQAVSRLAVSFRRDFLEKLCSSLSSEPFVPPAGVAPEKRRGRPRRTSQFKTPRVCETPFPGFFCFPQTLLQALSRKPCSRAGALLKEVPLYHPQNPFTVGEFFCYPSKKGTASPLTFLKNKDNNRMFETFSAFRLPLSGHLILKK